jgi:exopolysaccharide production protein ExoZ
VTIGVLTISTARSGILPTGEKLIHVLLSLLFIPHWSPAYPQQIWPYLTPGWTLNYEMFFYALFAISLASGKVVRAATVLISLLVIAGMMIHPTSAPGITWTNLALLQFLAGIWIGVAYRRADIRYARLLMPVAFAALLLLSQYQDAVVAKGIAASAVVLGSLAFEDRLHVMPLAKLLGDASYSIYLTHPVTVAFVSEIVRHTNFRGWAQFCLMVGLSLMLSAVVGILIHLWFERPMLRRLTRGSRGSGAASLPLPMLGRSLIE